jgi:hypothetical protein
MGMGFILHLDTYWVDRRDPIGIGTVKSFRDSIADDDDSTFSAPGFARGCSPKEYMQYDHVPSLETFKLIKAQGES